MESSELLNVDLSSSENKKRICLKVSGEALMGPGEYGIHRETAEGIAADISQIASAGVEICLVIGGGNIYRGLSGAAEGLERTTADYMGMLATVMNALAMQAALENLGHETRVLSAIPMDQICEPYIRRRAVRHLERGRIVIFAAGMGNPYMTTDTAAALRANEMHCDMLLKGTKVDGIYSADPKNNRQAERFDRLSYADVLKKICA